MQGAKLDTAYCSADCIDGIIEVQNKDDVYLTLESAKKIVEKRLGFSGQKTYPVLLKSSRSKGMDRAARKYLFLDGLKNMNAMALVPGNKVGQMLTTFLVAFERLPIPYKVFKTREEARKWLKNFSC